MDDEQQQVAKALYDQMLAAHLDHYGEASVKMRHYLRGLAESLTVRMGLQQELLAQSDDDRAGEARTGPVEKEWDRERRRKGIGPARKWREVRIIRSRFLETEKGWR